MKVVRQIVLAAFTLATCAVSVGGEPNNPSIWGERIDVALEVQRVLGVPAKGEGALLAILDARGTASKRRDRSLHNEDEAFWTRITDQVLSGQTPNQLTALCMSKASIPKSFSAYEKVENWRFSTASGRANIVSGLIEAAKSSKDPTRSQRMARAALVMAVNDEAGSGKSLSRAILNRFNAELLGLPKGQYEAIAQAIGVYQDRVHEAFFDDLLSLAGRFDQMIGDEAGKISSDEYRNWLASFERLFTEAPDDPSIVQNLCRLLWRFACLARARNHFDVVSAAAETSTRLTEQVANPQVRRWLLEAATEEGPIPKHSGYKVMPADIHADGWHKPPR